MNIVKAILLLSGMLCLHRNAFAQATQTVKGTVRDEASKVPLTSATIVLVNTALGTATDAEGNFRLTEVPLGRQSFRVSYLGYEDRMINDVVVTAGKEVTLNITLQEALRKLGEVTVTYKKATDKTRTNNDMAQVSARAFNMDETKRYAGALGDPSRMAANFAGVVSGNDANNDIVVKGNSPMGMLWQLEGLNVPNPNHFGSQGSTGGPVSMLNNNNLDKSDFITSAFPAQYGNALAGVFDIRLREGNREKHEFMGQVGFNGFEAGAEGPIGKNKRTSYLVNYRYSTLGVFQALGINFGTGAALPLYQDVNYKITSQIGKKGKLSLFGIAGNSRIDFWGKDVDTTKSNMYDGDPFYNQLVKYSATVTGLSYEHQLSAKTSTKLTIGYSTSSERVIGDSISTADGSTIPSYYLKTGTGKLSGVWSLMHKINAKNNMQAGILYDQTMFDMIHTNREKDGTQRRYVDQTGSFGLGQAYAQWKHRFNNSLSGVAGVHFQYLTIGGQAAVEPRMSLRYAVTAKHAVSIGYGLHHQAQNIYTYYLETPTPAAVQYTNKNLGFTRSQHFVTTYDWNITDNLRVKAEAYYQHISKVPVERFSSSFSALNSGAGFTGVVANDSLVNNGKGYNYGLEMTVERFFKHGYYFLVTGSLFNSRYEGSDGVERNTAFNAGHVLNVLAGKEFRIGKSGSVLAFNLKLTSVGGRYLTPIDFERSRNKGEAVYKDEIAYSDKQQDYFRSDIRIAFRREYKRSTLEVAIDFQNITNNQNIFGQSYDVRNNKIKTTYQQGFFPIPMVRYTF